MQPLYDDPIYQELHKAREQMDYVHEVCVAQIEGQRAEMGDRVTDYVLEQAQLEHSMLSMELQQRINKRIEELAEITSPIIGTTQQPKGNVMNDIETPEVVFPSWIENKDQVTKRQNRAYMWRQVRRGVKWTLLIAGTAAIIGHLVPEKDTTPEEVK